jgi:hypothetical protein
MLKTIFIALLASLLLFFFINGANNSSARLSPKGSEGNTGALEKMIVANGSVTMDLNLNRLNGISSGTSAKEMKTSALRFDAERDSFFTVMIFADELRGPLPSSMTLIPQNSANLPAKLNASYQQLVVENMPAGEPYELVVRDGKTGFTFFNIEGINSNTITLRGCSASRPEGCWYHKNSPPNSVVRLMPASLSDKFQLQRQCARLKSRRLLTAKSNRIRSQPSIVPMRELFRVRMSWSEICRDWRNSAAAAERRSDSQSEPIPAISVRLT